MRAIQTDERTTIGALDVEECIVLLRWENIGRLAVAAHGEAPMVVPVNFVFHEGHAIFRTGDGIASGTMSSGASSSRIPCA